MRQHLAKVGNAALAVGGALLLLAPTASNAVGTRLTEAYVHVPMPPRFRVVATELEGPVFANAEGHTLYEWPFKQLRVGDTGDPLGESDCTDVKTTVNSGFMSPYPPGLLLPDLATRKSCTQVWPR